MIEKNIPICPLMSAGSEFPIICNQEKCAWYVSGLKKCAMYMLGHNATLDVKTKTENKN